MRGAEILQGMKIRHYIGVCSEGQCMSRWFIESGYRSSTIRVCSCCTHGNEEVIRQSPETLRLRLVRWTLETLGLLSDCRTVFNSMNNYLLADWRRLLRSKQLGIFDAKDKCYCGQPLHILFSSNVYRLISQMINVTGRWWSEAVLNLIIVDCVMGLWDEGAFDLGRTRFKSTALWIIYWKWLFL